MTSPGSSSNKQDQVLNDLASFYMSSGDFDFTPPPSPTKDKVQKVDTPPTSDSEQEPVHVQRNVFISSQDVTSRRRKPSSKKRPTSSSALAAVMMAPVTEEANRRRVAATATATTSTSTTAASTTNSSRRAPKSSPNNHHSSGNKSSSATTTTTTADDDTFGTSSSTHRRVPPGRNKSVGGDSSTMERSSHHRRGRSIPAMGNNNNNNNNNSSHGSQHQRSVHAEKPQRSFSGGGSRHRRTTVPTPAKEEPLKGSSHGRSALDRLKSRSVSKGSRRLPARSHSDDLMEMNRSRRQQSQSRDTGRRRKRRSSEDSLALSNHAAQVKSELEEEDNLQKSMEDAMKSLKDQEEDGLADGQVDGILSVDALEKARDLKKVSSAQREAISTNQPVVLGRSGSEEGLSEMDRSRSNGGRRRRRPGAPSTSSTTKPSSSTSSNQGTSSTTKPSSSTSSNQGTSSTTKPSSSTSSNQGQHRGERRLRSSGRGKSSRSPNKQQQQAESSSSSKHAPRSPRKNQEPSSRGGSSGRRSPRSPRRNQEPSSSGGSSGRRSARGRGNSTKRSAIQDPTVVVEDDTADDDLSLTSPLKSSSRPSSNPSPLASKLKKVGHASQDEMSIQPADLGIPPLENTTDVAITGKNTAPSALKPTQHDDLIAQAVSRQEVLSETVENKPPKKSTSKLLKKLLSKGMKSKKKEPAVASTESTTAEDTTKSMESIHRTDSSDREDDAPVEKVGHASQDEMSIQPADLGIPPLENTTDVAVTGKNTAPSALKPTQHDDLIAQAMSRQEVLSETVENKPPKKPTSKLLKKLLSKGMKSKKKEPAVASTESTTVDDTTKSMESIHRTDFSGREDDAPVEKVGHASQDEMSIQPADLGIPPLEDTTDVAATGKNTAPSALKPTQHDDLIAQAMSRQEVLSETVETKSPKKPTSKLLKKLLSKGMKNKKKEPAVASTESTTVDDTTKSMESIHRTDSSDREDDAPVIPAATVAAVPKPEDTKKKSMLGKLLSKSSSSTGAQKDAAGEGEAGTKKKGSKWGGLKGGMDFQRQMIKIKKTKDNSKEATTQEQSSGGSRGALMEKTNVPVEPATTKKKGGLWKSAKEGAGSGNSALAKAEEAKGEESTKYGGGGGSEDLDYGLMMSLGSFSEDAIEGLADYLPKGTFPEGEGDDEDASDTKIDPADDDNAKSSSRSLRSSSKSLQYTESQEEKTTGDQKATNQSNAFAMLGKEAESDQPNAFSMLNIAPLRAPSITSAATTATTTATTAVNPADRRGMMTGLAAPSMRFDLDKQTDEVARRSEPAIIEECEEEDSEKDQEEIEDEDEAMSEYGTVKEDKDKDIMTDHPRGRTQEDEIEDELQSFLAPMNFMQLKIDPSTTNVVDLNVAMHALSEECKSKSTEGENTMNVQHMNEAGIDFEESSDSDSEVDKGAILMSCPSVVNNQTKLAPTYDVLTEYTQLLQELDASTTRTKRSREEVKSLQQEIQKQRRHYGEAERQHQMSLKALARHKIVMKR